MKQLLFKSLCAALLVGAYSILTLKLGYEIGKDDGIKIATDDTRIYIHWVSPSGTELMMSKWTNNWIYIHGIERITLREGCISVTASPSGMDCTQNTNFKP